MIVFPLGTEDEIKLWINDKEIFRLFNLFNRIFNRDKYHLELVLFWIYN